MSLVRDLTYDGQCSPYLLFDRDVPRLVLFVTDGKVLVQFPDAKAMETFRRQLLCLLEDAEKHMHLRLQMEFIEREKGGESE